MVQIKEMTGELQPLDVIVPTHNKLELTINCVNALYANTAAPWRLIVVDDSTDGLTPLYFERLHKERKNVTFIHSDEPFKSGNQFFNIALEHVKSPFVATVMNSITVDAEWEIVALQLLQDNDKLGIVGLKCLFPNGDIESAGITMLDYMPMDVGKGLPGHRLCGGRECLAVQWACAIMRKEAIGVLDENTYHGFLGWDDIDNCLVVRSKGWNVMYCGQGAVYHFPRATRENGTQDGIVKNLQNRERFYKRWGLWKEFRKANPRETEYFSKEKEQPAPEWLEGFIQRPKMNRAERRKHGNAT